MRDAATVVMVRDQPDGLHIYLQRRVRTMAFAAGMYVFPGGAVGSQDVERAQELMSAIAHRGPAVRRTPDWQSPGEDTLAVRIAAVRETLEETSHDLGDPVCFWNSWVIG